MFSVRYEVFETIDRLFNIFRSQNDVLLVLYLFIVCVAMCQGDKFSVHSICS